LMLKYEVLLLDGICRSNAIATVPGVFQRTEFYASDLALLTLSKV